ncbi:hypothetical protein SAMN04488516_11426 [Desulfonauticus submarinus]|uniref:Lipoprotein n=1 Tax=Desulfonauticus submarinus TaxID=206665 RepID=A0A1H0FTJ7_9BACT|nr:hypothetical protein [Desulfonauticus submarinus]SDN97998.1 hypothetical protein SAMN04488516_11426 [Desulfonauticus submarinus]
MQKIIICLICLMLSCSGCRWLGRVTGKIVTKSQRLVEKVKHMPEDFEKGYQEGKASASGKKKVKRSHTPSR